jgi:hypothetical protein
LDVEYSGWGILVGSVELLIAGDDLEIKKLINISFK